VSILLACDFDAGEWSRWGPALTAALPGERLLRSRGGGQEDGAIDIAIVANPRPGALAGLPGLRLVQSLWAGVERLLVDATLPREVPLARMVDPAMNAAMAETALWAVLSLQRGFFRYASLQRQARWSPHPQRRADELTAAVLGLGQMGRAAARRLAAHGCGVFGWSATPTELDDVECFSGERALEQRLLPEADVVINLLPLTPATRGLFDAARLARMKPDAALVNLARGAHVVEADLLAALDAGRLGHAVLDVFAEEPLPTAHPFWRHERVTVLPHAAAQTDPRSAAEVAATNVRALRRGEPLAYLVDRARGY